MARSVKIIRVNRDKVTEVPEFDIAVDAKRWLVAFHKVPEMRAAGTLDDAYLDFLLNCNIDFQRMLVSMCSTIAACVHDPGRTYVLVLLCSDIMMRRTSAMVEIMADILRRSGPDWSVTHETLGG